MTTSSEEHRDRQPRRPGRLHHHLQPRPGRRTGQRDRLDLGRAARGRPRLALGDRGTGLVEHPDRVRTRDTQVDPDQASARHLVSLGSG